MTVLPAPTSDAPLSRSSALNSRYFDDKSKSRSLDNLLEPAAQDPMQVSKAFTEVIRKGINIDDDIHHYKSLVTRPTDPVFTLEVNTNTDALRGHRLGYRLGWLVSLIYGRGTRIPRGA